MNGVLDVLAWFSLFVEIEIVRQDNLENDGLVKAKPVLICGECRFKRTTVKKSLCARFGVKSAHTPNLVQIEETSDKSVEVQDDFAHRVV